jgi:hypothetical protein
MSKALIAAQIALDPAKAAWTFSQWDAWLRETIQSETYRPIPSNELLQWSAEDGRYMKLETIAQTAAHPLYSAAKASLKIIDRDGTQLNLNLAAQRTLLGAMVAANVLLPDDSEALYALARIFHPRYAELGFVEFHDGDLMYWLDIPPPEPESEPEP